MKVTALTFMFKELTAGRWRGREAEKEGGRAAGASEREGAFKCVLCSTILI